MTHNFTHGQPESRFSEHLALNAFFLNGNSLLKNQSIILLPQFEYFFQAEYGILTKTIFDIPKTYLNRSFTLNTIIKKNIINLEKSCAYRSRASNSDSLLQAALE